MTVVETGDYVQSMLCWASTSGYVYSLA